MHLAATCPEGGTPLASRTSGGRLDGMKTSEVTTFDSERLNGLKRDTRRVSTATEAWEPRTVVVGFDGSPDATRAAQRAAAIVGSSGLMIPAEVLVDVAREYDADLVVVGRRGRDFAARVLLGSVAARIVANAACDVLVVS